MLYPIYVRKDAGSAYSATFPDLPGCFAAADEAQDLPRAAQEAVEAHYGADDESIPEPSTPDAHAHSEEYRGGYWMLVEIDLSRMCPNHSGLTTSQQSRSLKLGLAMPTAAEDAAIAAGIGADSDTVEITPADVVRMQVRDRVRPDASRH